MPVHRRLLWSAVTDPERLLGAVPNLLVEASSDHGVAARLRLRAGEKSITFRGIARLVDLAPDELHAVLEIEAVHGRSDGALDGRVKITLRPDGDGTRVELEPEFVLSGHAPTVSAEQLTAAGARLIPRWFAQLAGSGPAAPPAPVALTVVPDEPEPSRVPTPEPPAADVDVDEDEDEDEDENLNDRGLEPAAAEPEFEPEAEPAFPAEARPGPTFTLIPGAGDAQDGASAPAAAKAPLRLVAPREPDSEDELPEERDLWSERPGQLIAPVWVIGAALLAALGLLVAALRRIARHRRDVG